MKIISIFLSQSLNRFLCMSKKLFLEINPTTLLYFEITPRTWIQRRQLKLKLNNPTSEDCERVCVSLGYKMEMTSNDSVTRFCQIMTRDRISDGVSCQHK